MSCNVSEKHDPQSDRSCITLGSNVLFRDLSSKMFDMKHSGLKLNHLIFERYVTSNHRQIRLCQLEHELC